MLNEIFNPTPMWTLYLVVVWGVFYLIQDIFRILKWLFNYTSLRLERLGYKGRAEINKINNDLTYLYNKVSDLQVQVNNVESSLTDALKLGAAEYKEKQRQSLIKTKLNNGDIQ